MTATACAFRAKPNTRAARNRTNLVDFALASDFFYVLAIHEDGSIPWLLVERVRDLAWRDITLDLTPLIGQTVRLQFGTYNGGDGGSSRTYIDDASLILCPPEGALVCPRDGWIG